jgi:hypothetical protein
METLKDESGTEQQVRPSTVRMTADGSRTSVAQHGTYRRFGVGAA